MTLRDSLRNLQKAPEGVPVFATRVPARWPNVRPVAEYVEFCVSARSFEGPGKRASIAAHELLENAIKYGDLSTDIEIQVHMPERGTRFAVRVTNRVSDPAVTRLKAELGRIEELGTEKAFLEGMMRAGSRPSGSSMIGLARVAHEAEVRLSLEVSGDLVTVVAQS